MEYKDYYALLEVSRTASADEVKRAYRRLARRFHPDVSKEPQAEERFKAVQEAYEVLKDPEKRGAYDRLGSDWRSGQSFRPPPDWGAGFEFRGGGAASGDAAGAFGGGPDPVRGTFRRGRRGAAGGDEGFSEFFSSLFGAESPFGAAAARRGTGRGGAQRGEDRHAWIDVAPVEAFRGGTKTLELRHPELGDDGRVEMRSRTLRVSVPAGVVDGQLVRLAGQGAPGPEGSPAGDLYLQVRVQPDPDWTVEGRDVTRSLPVAPWEAALGATLRAPTLGGEVELRIPPGARSGQKLRLRGRGLPGEPPGDQFVVLRIVVPPAETPRARELWEALRRELDFDPRATAAR